MIVLIGIEKGGTGKSTVATMLAAMRAARGHDVLLIDGDPQGTSTLFAAARENHDVPPVTCVAKTGPSFRKDVSDLARRYEDVIIDAGGRDSTELRAAMVVAERIYMPLQPSSPDVWVLDRMEELVDQARAFNDLEAYVVLNRAYADPRIPETESTLELIKEYQNFTWCGVSLCERIDFKRACGAGLSPEELSPQGKAAQEARALYEHIYAREVVYA